MVAVGLLMPTLANAQASVEVNAGIQFDFVNPGARSLGLGGAFTGLADDATSAFTNPAGLRFLTRPEISIEGRYRHYSTLFTHSGHAFGVPTGEGIDTQLGLVDRTSKDAVFGASFISAVYPKGDWAVAAYRHELARFRTSIETEGAFYNTGLNSIGRAFPAAGDLELDVVAYGASASRRLHESLSVGLSVALYNFRLESETRRYGIVSYFFEPAVRETANLVNSQTQTGDDTAVGFNAGLSWDINRAVQLGIVYRQGPNFNLEIRNTLPDGAVALDTEGQFNVPDVFGIGLAFRPAPSLRVAVDYNRVLYSSLAEDFVVVFGGNSEQFSVDDAHELHAGVEYALLNLRRPVFLRGGLWYDPAHSIEFDVFSSGILAESVLFRPRADVIHYAVGAGIALGGGLEANAGADFSKRNRSLSVSTVVRF